MAISRRFRGPILAAVVLAAGVGIDACSNDDPGDAVQEAGTPDADSTADTSSSRDVMTTEDAPFDANEDASLLSPSFVYRDINHILSTGQSLSVGTGGSPPLSTTQPFDNTMFVTGVIAGGTGLTSFVPLHEGTLETMSSGLTSLVTQIARTQILIGQPTGKTSHDLLLSAHGVGGIAYSGLKKGTAAYANGIAQAQAGHDLATAMGKTHVVRVVTNVHGETDSNNNNTQYEANLVEWQSNYETDVKAITGQTEGIPMLQTQISAWTSGNAPTSIVPAQQLAAHIDHPGQIILVGAKYHLPYASDGLHLSNEGYRHMGEDYAKVYRRVILEGKPWEPVRPLSVTRAGVVVTAKMAVPAPPLVLDTTLVSDPGNYGFEWTNDGTAATITKVEVMAPDTVVITLSGTPGANGHLRYAFTGVSGHAGGPTTGPRGNLRDSDTTVSRNSYALYNWCVHFDAAVP